MNKIINKNSMTNIISVLVLLLGLAWGSIFGDSYRELGQYIMYTGLFALSGGLTNWLAIYMLFERVPFLYGSGVIVNNFDKFTQAIREMILDNFFSEDNFEVLSQELSAHTQADNIIDSKELIKQIDMNTLFDGLVELILESSFGGAINMFGGAKVLESMREPFRQKMGHKVSEILHDIDFSHMIKTHSSYEVLRPKIEMMIDKKLEELSPQHVKELIEKMIKNHLGWLVVWGGFFGGLIGLLSAIFLV